MKTGQFRIGTRLAIGQLREDVRLRSRQAAVPKGLFGRTPRRALNLAQEDRNRSSILAAHPGTYLAVYRLARHPSQFRA